MDTILIVDDDSAIREIFTIYLETGGYRILDVPGGMECLELLKTQKPDLILLDLMMEPMDGWETLLAIRSLPHCCYLPVTIITGKQPVARDIVQYGCQIEDFIVKPVDFRKIVASLHHTINQDRERARLAVQKKEEGKDPAFIAEYICLLRLVRLTHHLIRKYKETPWADRIFLQKHEERLQWLHKKLAFPDILLEE